VTIRLDNYAGAEDRLIRVLDVEDRSPAHVAGLVPYQDYLLGTTTSTLDSTETLAALLKAHRDRVVELYVYNCDTDVVRVVALLPTSSWGGRGLLGAAVGTGYLHRLPSRSRHTEGVSVERKVRYVGVDSGAPSSSSSLAAAAGGPNRTAIPELGSAASNRGGRGGGFLVLEPELEMEPDDAGDNESTTTDLSSVALSAEDGAAAPRSAPSAVSARGVVVETVTNEPEDEEVLHHQNRKRETSRPDPNGRSSSSWIEPVHAQERGASDSGRIADEPDRSVDRESSPPSLPASGAASAGSENERLVEPVPPPIADGAARRYPDPPPASPSRPPPAQSSFGFLPPPPKMHYTAST
jgi:hypothetical protein